MIGATSPGCSEIPRTQGLWAQPAPRSSPPSLPLGLGKYLSPSSEHKYFPFLITKCSPIEALVSSCPMPGHSMLKSTKLWNIRGNKLVVNSPSWRISAVRIFGCSNSHGARRDCTQPRPITAHNMVTWPGHWPITGLHLVTWPLWRRSLRVSNDKTSLCSGGIIGQWQAGQAADTDHDSLPATTLATRWLTSHRSHGFFLTISQARSSVSRQDMLSCE